MKQFATFISKTVAKRVELGQRSSVEHEGHLVHVQVRMSGLAAVAVCDKEYPGRVAFTLLTKVLEEFSEKHAEGAWRGATGEMGFAELSGMVAKYQDPHEADAIMKIQKDLDETKIILHKTIDSVLERGVKLDNLVEKSTDLSAQSKMYVFLVLCVSCFFVHPASLPSNCFVYCHFADGASRCFQVLQGKFCHVAQAGHVSPQRPNRS